MEAIAMACKRGSRPEPTTSPDDPEIVRLLQDALTKRLQLMATYVSDDGVTDHVFYPLALGTSDGGYRLWTYQFAGGSGVGWRCFVVAGLIKLTARPGAWLVPASDPGPGRCMDEVVQRVRESIG
jgi:hypothetical protein